MRLPAGRKTIKPLALIAAAWLLVSSGCGSTITGVTEKGLFHIKLSSKGTLLKYGRNEFDIYVTDEKYRSVEGALVEVTPWMPEHGHSAEWPPTVVEKGKGIYRAVMPITMIGHWHLTIRISKRDREDSAVFDFPFVD